jgi:NO-binding membrane sensor protein with MHYT domain
MSASTEFCSLHSGTLARLDNVEEDNRDQWEAIKNLQNRLPVWATMLISLLTFALGVTLTYASLAIQLSQSHN